MHKNLEGNYELFKIVSEEKGKNKLTCLKRIIFKSIKTEPSKNLINENYTTWKKIDANQKDITSSSF